MAGGAVAVCTWAALTQHVPLQLPQVQAQVAMVHAVAGARVQQSPRVQVQVQVRQQVRGQRPMAAPGGLHARRRHHRHHLHHQVQQRHCRRERLARQGVREAVVLVATAAAPAVVAVPAVAVAVAVAAGQGPATRVWVPCSSPASRHCWCVT